MFTFFFTEASPFSQWYRCSFTAGANKFNCAEQYMMHGKALLFDVFGTVVLLFVVFMTLPPDVAGQLVRQSEAGMGRCPPDVGRQQQLDAAARADAVHRGDDRL